MNNIMTASGTTSIKWANSWGTNHYLGLLTMTEANFYLPKHF